MRAPLVLCLYLLIFVIDFVSIWVRQSMPVLIWIWFVHLCVFIVLIRVFRHEFYVLSEKLQTRIVFNPRVYACFSVACAVTGLWLLGASGATMRWWSLVLSLLLFWTGASLFDFFPVKTRMVDRLLVWSGLFGVVWVALLVWTWVGSFWNISFSLRPQGEESEQSGEVLLPIETWAADTKTGVSLDMLQELLGTGSTLVSWAAEQTTGSASTWAVNDTGAVLFVTTGWSADPLTYRVLLPFFENAWLLPETTAKPTFTNLSSTDPLYPAFQRAWGLKMIGTNIKPDWQVRCENLMVLIGLAKKWQVSSALPVLDAYRQAAELQDARGSCVTRQQLAMQDMLQIIK